MFYKEDPKACKENLQKKGLKRKLHHDKKLEPAEILPLKKQILRKSSIIKGISQKEGFQISKKTLADYEQVYQGARLAYLDTHKDLKTLLNMEMDRRVCIDLDQALKCERSVLANRYHINFEFQMQRADYEGALSSFRSVSCSHYPNKKDLHGILYTIIEKTNDIGVLQRAQDLLYKVLSLHPPIDQTMRLYYSFLLSSRQNDTDVAAPSENLMNLLEQILTDDESNFDFARNSSIVERKKATLGFIVQLLYEDFYCWIHCACDHSESIRNREEMPLIANILWPRSTIPVLNSNCRKLINFHISALQSQPDHVFYTQPLVNMMGAITQLTEPRIPLKFRKPSENMMNLAREIISLAGYDVMSQSYLFTSFGLRELELLLPLVVLNNLKPGTGCSNPNIVSLRSLVENYLVENETRPAKVLEKFQSETVEYRRVFLSALSAYFNLFGIFKAWHSIAHQSKSPSMINQNFNVSFPMDVFSDSYTLDHFIDDLRQANPLLKKISLSNPLPKKSLYSFLCLNVE